MSAAQDLPDTTVTAKEAIDGMRVEERSRMFFFRNMWDSYKGHYRGGLAGVAIGGLIGAPIGLAICALPVVGWALAPLVIPALTGAGAMLGAEGFSMVGSAAASRASSLAEKHARFNDPIHKGDTLSALNDKLMTDGREHHYEYPPERDKGKTFFWKSGIVGALISGGLGGLIGWAGAAALFPAATVATLAVLPIGAALVFGVLGLTFGVNRSIFKSIFNQTDANIQGKIHDGRQGPDLGRAQLQEKENDPELLQHRLRRQAEITKLDKEYGKKIFWGGVGGRFRGFAGGALAGILVGVAAGVAACGVACLLPGVAVTWAMFGTLAGVFSAIGGLFGIKIFADAGTEAGAESTARAIDEEFERTRLLKGQGLTLPELPKVITPWFNPKAAFTAGLVGAAIGIGLAPILGAAALGMLGITGATIIQTMGVSALISGLVGTVYGFSGKVWEGIGNVTDWIYEKSYFPISTEKLEKAPAQSITPPPYMQEKITAEEMAKINASTQQKSNFGSTLAQKMAAPSPMTTGM